MSKHFFNPKRRSHSTFTLSLGEWFFALFLYAGYYKADPRLASIQTRIDFTLLFLTLSFLVFLYRLLTKPFAQKIPIGFVKVALFFLLLASTVLGGLFSTHSTVYGLDKALRFIVLTGWAFFGVAFLIISFQSLISFSWALATISTVMAIDALLNYPGVGQLGFVTALGSNYIALARAGGFGLLATLVFLLPIERKPLLKISLLVIAVLQLGAALSAGARGPVLALMFSFLIFFALSVQGFLRLKVDRFAWKLSVFLLTAVVLIGVVGQEFFATLFLRMHLLMTDLDDSAARRLYLYEEAIKLWASSPIWGVGTGGFAMAVTGSTSLREYPHNIILELGAETGLLGILAFVAMLFVAFNIGLGGIRNSSGLAKVTSRYLLVVTTFALFNAMFSGDINDNRMLFTWLALLAIRDRFWKRE